MIALSPDPVLLAVGVAADVVVGDPVYAWHPVRLIGRCLSWLEGRLRSAGLDGYGGGILLFVMLATLTLTAVILIIWSAAAVSSFLGLLLHAVFVYSFLALGDLVQHVWRIERAVRADNLHAARGAVAAVVGRDTDRMDGAACRRAAVESLSENLTDGFVSPVAWYLVAGLPGLVLFKVVSTMDQWSASKRRDTSASDGAVRGWTT